MSKDKNLVSMSGAPIFRYTDGEKEWEAPNGEECIEEMLIQLVIWRTVILPESWKIDDESFKNEKWYWPVRLLKFLARFPHKYETWLALGHTIPNGGPSEPFAENTDLLGSIILPSVNVPEEFRSLKISKDKTIEFYSIVPLYEKEMNLKLKKGSNPLLDKFDRYGISDLIIIDRKNVAKKCFGIF